MKEKVLNLLVVPLLLAACSNSDSPKNELPQLVEKIKFVSSELDSTGGHKLPLGITIMKRL